jgi:gamma-glutamyltranspeptidase/glutathione hydrolase
MAMRAAEKDRIEYVGDPDYVNVPIGMLTSKQRAEEWRKHIDSGGKIVVQKWAPIEPPSTTHLSILDPRGNAVSLTHSLGSCSGVITPGLGFFYNNAMINFNPIPGKPNSIAPGKSRNTQMAPTIVLDDNQPYIIVGAPGGGRIISALMQTITNIIDHSMTAFEAVAHPRVFCLHTDIIDVSSRIPSYVCEELEAMGNLVVRSPSSYDTFASPQAIVIDRVGGKILGGSDPRNKGVVLST